MKNYSRLLSMKGKLTILEKPDGKVAVAIQLPAGSILTLENGCKERLLIELWQLCRDMPDNNFAQGESKKKN